MVEVVILDSNSSWAAIVAEGSEVLIQSKRVEAILSHDRLHHLSSQEAVGGCWWISQSCRCEMVLVELSLPLLSPPLLPFD
jgi:hypothetical protein